jgi:hypothetical protein
VSGSRGAGLALGLQYTRRVSLGPLRHAGLVLLVGAVGASGLGLSITYYACPMQPEPAASPCCPASAREPAAEPSFEAGTCCEANHVDIAAAPAEARRSAPEVKPADLIAIVFTVPAAVPRVVEPTRWLRPLATYGPPPLERTTRLLI